MLARKKNNNRTTFQIHYLFFHLKMPAESFLAEYKFELKLPRRNKEKKKKEKDKNYREIFQHAF